MLNLYQIPVTAQAPSVGRIVLVRYERAAGGAIDTLPAVVARVIPGPVSPDHPRINAVPFGDAMPSGSTYCPLSGAGEPLLSVFLFDPIDPNEVPDVPTQRRETFAGKRLWCEWMPYQKGQASKTEELLGRHLLRLAEVESRVAALAELTERLQADAGLSRVGAVEKC